MPPSPRLLQTACVGPVFLCCIFLVGCGDRPATESIKMHPNGIGLDIETIPKPAAKPSR